MLRFCIAIFIAFAQMMDINAINCPCVCRQGVSLCKNPKYNACFNHCNLTCKADNVENTIDKETGICLQEAANCTCVVDDVTNEPICATNIKNNTEDYTFKNTQWMFCYNLCFWNDFVVLKKGPCEKPGEKPADIVLQTQYPPLEVDSDYYYGID